MEKYQLNEDINSPDSIPEFSECEYLQQMNQLSSNVSAEYEEQYLHIHSMTTKNGNIELTSEMKKKNLELYNIVKSRGLLPIPDVMKIDDCDLLYRFLIQTSWSVHKSAGTLEAYCKWRIEKKINTILYETIDETLGDLPKYRGFDRMGHPVYYYSIRPKTLLRLHEKHSLEWLLRRQTHLIERGRYLSKLGGTDRVTCVLDFSELTISSLNATAMKAIKAISAIGQDYYPENMHHMTCCNGGWAITAAWKLCRPLLDKRTQQKIHFVSGPPSVEILKRHIDPSQIPVEYGGTLTPDMEFSCSPLMNGHLWRIDKSSPFVKLPDMTANESAETISSPEKQMLRTASRATEFSVKSDDPLNTSNAEESLVPITMAAASSSNESDGFYSLETSESETTVKDDVSSTQESSQQPETHAFPQSDKERFLMHRTPGKAMRCAGVDYEMMHNLDKNDRSRTQLDLSQYINGTNPVVLNFFTNKLIPFNACMKIDHIPVVSKFDRALLMNGTGQCPFMLLKEAGHTFRAVYLLVNPLTGHVRFRLKMQLTTNVMSIYTIEGDKRLIPEEPKVPTRSGNSANYYCCGEKIHTMTVERWIATENKSDWVLTRRVGKGKVFLAEKEDNKITVERELINNLSFNYAMCLVVVIAVLWRG